MDYEEKFNDLVIKNFVESYQKGETPIPCVQCNQYIKFSELLNTAKAYGANYLATGHYIKIQNKNNKLDYILLMMQIKIKVILCFKQKKKTCHF